MTDLFTERRAWWSDEEPVPLYRYMLQVVWDSSLPMLVCIFANSSKANEEKNDPTVGRVEARARSSGFGGYIMLNAFAYIATDPDDMRAAAEPIGKFNNAYIRNTLTEAKIKGWTIWIGWGEIGRHMYRDMELAMILRDMEIEPVCLKITASGQPGHPLYISSKAPFQPWPKPA